MLSGPRLDQWGGVGCQRRRGEGVGAGLCFPGRASPETGEPRNWIRGLVIP